MKFVVLLFFIHLDIIVGGPHNLEKREHVDHETLLTDSHTGEKNSKTSRGQLRALAEKMDSDQDGFVNKAELTSYINETLRRLDKEESLEEFRDVDVNGDGFVTWDEYKIHLDAEKEADDDEPTVEKLPLDDDDATFFRTADQDNDGKLDRDEFANFKNPENSPRMHEQLIENTLKERDSNRDGFIDLNEFLPSKGVNDDTEWYAAEASRFKEDFDKNKDGRLDRQEILSWLVPDSDQTAREESGHLIKEADTDKDGRLSYDEIEAEYDLFASSEATNFGEDLEYKHEEL